MVGARIINIHPQAKASRSSVGASSRPPRRVARESELSRSRMEAVATPPRPAIGEIDPKVINPKGLGGQGAPNRHPKTQPSTATAK
jgi:hypothetical protein